MCFVQSITRQTGWKYISACEMLVQPGRDWTLCVLFLGVRLCWGQWTLWFVSLDVYMDKDFIRRFIWEAGGSTMSLLYILGQECLKPQLETHPSFYFQHLHSFYQWLCWQAQVLMRFLSLIHLKGACLTEYKECKQMADMESMSLSWSLNAVHLSTDTWTSITCFYSPPFSFQWAGSEKRQLHLNDNNIISGDEQNFAVGWYCAAKA